jgi:hypothetical protein
MDRNEPLVATLSKEDGYWKAEGPHGVGVGDSQESAMDSYMDLVNETPTIAAVEWQHRAMSESDDIVSIVRHTYSGFRQFLTDEQAFEMTKTWFKMMFKP